MLQVIPQVTAILFVEYSPLNTFLVVSAILSQTNAEIIAGKVCERNKDHIEEETLGCV